MSGSNPAPKAPSPSGKSGRAAPPEAAPTVDEEPTPGAWYDTYCRGVGGLLARRSRPDVRRGKLEAALERTRERREAAAKKVVQLSARDGTRSSRERAEAKVGQLDRLLRVQQEGLERTRFRRELHFAGLRATPEEVHYAALATFLLTSVVLFAVFLALLVLSAFTVSISLLLVLMVALFVPVTLYLFLYNYPGMLGKRLRVQTLGRAPEVIHHMAMSLRLNPSLHQAIEAAGRNTEGPLGQALQKLTWEVSSREVTTTEEAFQAFASDWGYWNEEFMRALYAVRLAVLEDTKEGRARSLEKAQEIVLGGTQRRIEEFASRLGGPTTVLFGLGILLPLVVGAMLPMVFLSNLGTGLGATPGAAPAGAPAGAATNATGPNPEVTLVGFILAMNVAFPLVSLVYAMQIVSRRPGTTTPPVPPKDPKDRWSGGRASVLGVLGGGATAALALPAASGALGSSVTLVWPVFLVLGLAVGVSLGASLVFGGRERRRKALQRLEGEFPDLLFQIASRMSEGSPLVLALAKTAEGSDETEGMKLLDRLLFGIKVTGHTPEEVLFGDGTVGGLLHDVYPSRQLRVAFRALLDAERKGPEAVMQSILPMAEQLKELQATDARIRAELQGTVQMMNGTAFFFAPLTMGMTGALYLLLSGVVSSGALPVAPPIFFLVMGVYLLETVFVTLHFAVGIEHGGDRVLFWSLLGRFLWMAGLMFVAASVGGVLFLGSGGI